MELLYVYYTYYIVLEILCIALGISVLMPSCIVW